MSPAALPAMGRGLADFLSRWADLLEASSFPALVVDADGAVRLCNPAARARLGGEPVALSGVPPDRRAEVVLADGRVALAFPLGDGALLALPDAAPELGDAVLAALDDADDLLLGVTPDGLVAYANRAARALLGDALLGTFLPLVAPPAALVALSDGDGGAHVIAPSGGGPRRVLHWRCTRGQGPFCALWGRDVTDLHEAQLQLALRVRRVDALHDVAMAMARGGTVPRIADLALSSLEPLLPAREGRVTLLEGDTLRVLVARRDGAPHDAPARGLLSSSPADAARARRRPLQVSMEEAQRYPALRSMAPQGVRCALYAPLQVEEAVFGFLELYNDAGDRFSDEEVELVARVASMVAAAMVRERLLEQVARHAQAMEQRVALRSEELTRTQEQLIQAAKLSSIGELAAGLVHELNQPLNVLGGYVELLAEGGLPDAARARALDVMSRAVARMTTMVENLRNFSRAGGPNVVSVDLEDVVHMARELTAGAPRRGVLVECAAGVRVLGDGNRLEQVVINLVANALQVEGDPVQIRVRADDDRALLEVSDRGPGVPVPLRERIFDAFFTTKPAGQGTGLGLSVSARIVQEHGGRIEVHDNPGGGALFRVVLPLHRERR